MSVSTEDKTDVTARATAAGWTLPEGWRVLAWTEHDDDHGDPRNKGEAYNTDVEEADYNHPTRAFCKHCDAWIRELDVDAVTGMGPDADGRDPESGDWADSATGIDCPGSDHRRHEPSDPLVVRMWREDAWEFVIVFVQVVDQRGRVWGEDTLGSVEQGTFPHTIDRETGAVTTKEIDPITDPHHPLPDMLGEALASAQAELIEHGAAAPKITLSPAGSGTTEEEKA